MKAWPLPSPQLYNWIEAGRLTRTELVKFYNFLTFLLRTKRLSLHWPPDKLHFCKIINWSTSTSTPSSHSY